MLEEYEIKYIDKKILRLVEEMNKTRWIKTLFCCEGHPGARDDRRNPYVDFHCRKCRIELLADICSNIMKRARKEKIELDLVLGIKFMKRLSRSFEEPPGYLAMGTDFRLKKIKNNGRVLEIAAEEFEEINKKKRKRSNP